MSWNWWVQRFKAHFLWILLCIKSSSLPNNHQGATSQRCAFSHEAIVAPYLLDEKKIKAWTVGTSNSCERTRDQLIHNDTILYLAKLTCEGFNLFFHSCSLHLGTFTSIALSFHLCDLCFERLAHETMSSSAPGQTAFTCNNDLRKKTTTGFDSYIHSHRIHGTGIFTYMNGWFSWCSCRQIYRSHGSVMGLHELILRFQCHKIRQISTAYELSQPEINHSLNKRIYTVPGTPNNHL